MLMWKNNKKESELALHSGRNKPQLVRQKDDKNIHKALFFPQPCLMVGQTCLFERPPSRGTNSHITA